MPAGVRATRLVGNESLAKACRWDDRPSVVRLGAMGDMPVALGSRSRWVPLLAATVSPFRSQCFSPRTEGPTAAKHSTWPWPSWRCGDRSPQTMISRYARRGHLSSAAVAQMYIANAVRRW